MTKTPCSPSAVGAIEADEATVRFFEGKVRRLLTAAHGDDFGQALLAISSAGNTLVIDLCEGGNLTLSTPAETAQALLEHFEWTPPDCTNRGDTDYVFRLCENKAGAFTLRDVIGSLLEDKPEMIRNFGSAWGRLISQKVVRILSRRRPFLYELSYANSWFF